MEFTSLRQSRLNLSLFEAAETATPSATIEKAIATDSVAPVVTYTEESLLDLKEHCEGILEKGEDATPEELDSLQKALDEVASLQKGQYESDGIIVPFYYKGELPQ
jgi:hypothetical protein